MTASLKYHLRWRSGHPNASRHRRAARKCKQVFSAINLDFCRFGLFHSVDLYSDPPNNTNQIPKPALRKMLAGGAYGSDVTRRKRKEQEQNQSSLANMLTNVLQQWQGQQKQQPENQPWRRHKRRKQHQERWDWQQSNDPNFNDSALARDLLQLLQDLCKKKAGDQEVIATTSTFLKQWQKYQSKKTKLSGHHAGDEGLENSSETPSCTGHH